MKKVGTILIYFLLILLTVITIIPFYLVVVNATHTSYDIVTKINLLPGKALAENYSILNQSSGVWRAMLNSFIISTAFTLTSAYFGTMVAFGFSKYRFKLNKFFFTILLLSMMIPSQVSIIGYYKLCLNMHMVNSWIPFIIPFFAPGITSVSTIFFLRGMISEGVSDSMLEAARIEGSNEIQIFHSIVFPCMIPGIATMSIFNFVSSWNNYLGPLILISDMKKYTMPILIATIRGVFITHVGSMYLAIAISMIFIVIIYLWLSRYIIAGLTMGSEK